MDMTLPSVIGGYLGNPFIKNVGWIEDSIVDNTLRGRFPSNAVELDPFTEKLVKNKFSELPLGFGEWPVRPLELATLRLQNMIGIVEFELFVCKGLFIICYLFIIIYRAAIA